MCARLLRLSAYKAHHKVFKALLWHTSILLIPMGGAGLTVILALPKNKLDYFQKLDYNLRALLKSCTI